MKKIIVTEFNVFSLKFEILNSLSYNYLQLIKFIAFGKSCLIFKSIRIELTESAFPSKYVANRQ